MRFEDTISGLRKSVDNLSYLLGMHVRERDAVVRKHMEYVQERQREIDNYEKKIKEINAAITVLGNES